MVVLLAIELNDERVGFYTLESPDLSLCRYVRSTKHGSLHMMLLRTLIID